MQILIPIANNSEFFPKSEFYFPKPLIEVDGKSMIELVIQNLIKYFPNEKFIFSLDQKAIDSFSIDKTIYLATKKSALIVPKTGETQGALCSCLLCIDHINPDEPLIICNSDQIIDSDLKEIINEFNLINCDAGIITFNSLHPRFSYIKSCDGKVLNAAEKKVISDKAIAGFIYYKQASLFLKSAQNVIIKNDSFNGKFFISSTINELILSGHNIRHRSITSGSYHSFYSPAKIDEYEKYRLKNNQSTSEDELGINIVIPAAGLGSRFSKAGWKRPKPFIRFGNATMIEHVIKNMFIKNAKFNILLRTDHIENFNFFGIELDRKHLKLSCIEDLTEGTACTVLQARKLIDNDKPLIIGNSDQIVELDLAKYLKDCLERDLDGSILVFKDPTLSKKWSYAKIDKSGHVMEVAEKNPISDLATVGIYLFTKGSYFVKGAIDMISRNERINGEFYTCPVYNYLIKEGLKIGVYEIHQNLMHGIGTPEDLRSFLEIKNMGKSPDMPI